jgi:hypothetical protein
MKTIPKAQVPGLTKARNPIQIVALLAASLCGRSTWFRRGTCLEIRSSLPLSSGRLPSLVFG